MDSTKINPTATGEGLWRWDFLLWGWDLLLCDTDHDDLVVVVDAEGDAVAVLWPGQGDEGTHAVVFRLAILGMHHPDIAHALAAHDTYGVAGEADALRLRVVVLMTRLHRETHVEVASGGPCAGERQRVGGDVLELYGLVKRCHDHLVHRYGLRGAVGRSLVVGEGAVERVGSRGPADEGVCVELDLLAVVGDEVVGLLRLAGVEHAEGGGDAAEVAVAGLVGLVLASCHHEHSRHGANGAEDMVLVYHRLS